MQKTRLRIRFTKTGDLRWISHRDLARLWERLLRRSNLKLAFSEGFHPKPKISFPSALALGIEAVDEVVELVLEGEFEIDEVRRRIEEQLHAGMQLVAMESLPPGAAKAQVSANTYRVELPATVHETTCRHIERLLNQTQIVVLRDGKTIAVDTRAPNFKLFVDEGWLHFTLPVTRDGSLRPSELLDQVGLAELLEQGAVLQRIEVILEPAACTGSGNQSEHADEDEDASHEAALHNKVIE